MFLTSKLFEAIFERPYYNIGLRKLQIITGYASSSFLHHILGKFPEIQIELIIGMAKKDGINFWDHQEYIRLTSETNRVKVYYLDSIPGNHSKIYYWKDETLFSSGATFVGSANFSWNGFRDQNELMVQTNYASPEEVFTVGPLIECTENIDRKIKLHTVRATIRTLKAPNEEFTGAVFLNKQFTMLPYVDLPLYDERTNSVQQIAGLNWGQRLGREPNQAYIKVPTQFNKDKTDFFPSKEQEFTMLTDDGDSFVCVMAQEGRKAIETTRNNSILGRYFRDRLGLKHGVKVELEDLEKYGNLFVRVYKIDNETYYMDYSVPESSYKISK
ncbi:restriction endonuclease PLD domain-containing protein [Peribacillus butanolivorans]|uniref:restriction endonuclease PLD domain-containing protein n=1 Tax=Peribacillus butanolivorans TaxID=421767 RepID=UPI00366F1955